ncbi:MAG: NADP-dependent malic enzyme [Phenylobacterium sp.]|uniref:NADP-dependent malic enzyme n=1 Tax=Phenylobacterium sp. TaxID=1871053 RepID=UPI0027173264|nr:NADP-dependent malic enzyme [Phenylobacterium sp.]MDO8913149.1 NADP-dependent malic enzyme [Phenylobacterium sp.]MDP2011221.1 NADP-dependent malic enzyme [Phenylobacterium sp.]MDP3098980.1 NADP-dependent malic enzyme [Phenylobacterium sp.]MDP3633897.1 NADP-dependent malic enzyme [Phenylobacterium sp.]MDP3867324.1 NADP-dependent malic enzyme [Phenylobacterium sp.]
MSDAEKRTFTDEEALSFHRDPTPGKIAIVPTKPMATQRDLSLAYSPGVAVPVLAIAENPELAYDYTSKGNLVAVISNGTAILGLGNLGALAAKPVMEGKSVLFKRFADVDSIDIEVSATDPDEVITVVKNIGVTFGGINLEDIKSPECFRIETELQELLDIPVFHDDQHGTAIISCAGLINACHITGRELKDVKVVLCGAGAAGIASLDLMKAMGVRHDNCIAVDNTGVIYRGRTAGMNQWKSAHAVDTDARTLAEALVGADVFLGLSAKGVLTQDMIMKMAPNPLIFAMANPDPEILPEEVHAVRPDAIVGTGRSDYPNQVNNVLGFPYIFRGALDVRARRVNLEMKIACANALAQLAREDVPDEVAAAYHGQQLKFGPQYIIPSPFDPRLIWYIPPFVAQAAMDSGVARRPIEDMDAYRASLAQRLDPTAAFLQKLQGTVQTAPKKTIVFAEGEEPSVIRAAYAFQSAGLGQAVLVGREDLVLENMVAAGLDPKDSGLEIINARLSHRNPEYVEYLYGRLARQGFLKRDVQRLINQDRNSFAAAMVALGHADGMVTGVTRSYDQVLEEVLQVIDPAPDGRVMGMSVVLAKGHTLFIADTNVTEMPEADELVEIALQAARTVSVLGYTPRVAFMSYSTFGNPMGQRSEKVREAVAMLDEMDVDFEYEGEMPPELALDPEKRVNYPFMRLTGPANVLIMPAIHSAAISTQLVQAVGGATVIGPLLLGLSKSVQICPLSASVSRILQMATVAAYEQDLVEAQT